MFIEYIPFFAFLLITVSCASTSYNGSEAAVQFSQVGEVLIKKALDAPEISSQITSSSRAILSSIAAKNEYVLPFYDFAVQAYNFYYFGFDSEDPQSWNDFINNPFRDFARMEPDQAQEIVNKIVLPHHPFLSQVPFTFKIADFLGHFIPDIDVFLDKVAYNIFIQQFSQFLTLEDTSEAEILLKDLLYKAKNTSFPDPEFKYHHAFIANVPFEYLKRTRHRHSENLNSINSFISQLAPSLYNEIAEDSKQLADKILAGLLPSIFITLTDTSYENTIGKYRESLLQPNDKSYLWDPQEFHGDIFEALQALRIVENYNLPPYLKITEFLSGDSDLAHLFRHYIAQNYGKPKPSDLPSRDQPLFWRSLIFSSFADFFSICPHISHQILQQLQLSTSLDEGQPPFFYGLLGNRLHSPYHLVVAAGWGHVSTVDRLLQRCNYISADNVSRALLNAAKCGYTSTVKLLLQRRTDLSADHVSWALRSAAKGGQTSTLKLLFQRRTDFSADHVSSALQNAAKGGHAFTVDCILLTRNDIPINYIGRALVDAAQFGHTYIVDFLLQRRNDISCYHVGCALQGAAKGGHTCIVDCLLQHRDDISASCFGWAIQNAAKGGHVSIFDCLLQRRDDISDYHVGSVLRNAAESGHTIILEHLFQRRTNIPSNHVNQALQSASQAGHTAIVELIRQHKLNMNL
jgi:hypothetical protein